MLVGGRHTTSTVVNGFVCWIYEDCILALNAANFGKMDKIDHVAKVFHRMNVR